jgi:peptidase E
MSGSLFLLGPQRPTENVGAALDRIPGSGPIVTLTAGWRLDEKELDALHGVVGPDAVHLPLYQWFEECMERMPETRARYRERQQQLMRVKDLYRVRLHRALDAVRTLLERLDDAPDLVRPQLTSAVADVRRIDRQFVDHSKSLFAAYPDVSRPWELPEVASRRAESAAMLSSARAILIAGGHVAVLRNRMLFFGVHQQLFQAWLQRTGVIAWGAGAMVLTDPIVLFYDDPPDGPSHPEILDSGLALVQDTVVLPDARKRLRLGDRMRVQLLARRFQPHRCIAMENGAFLEAVGGTFVQRGPAGTASVLTPEGRIEPMETVP